MRTSTAPTRGQIPAARQPRSPGQTGSSTRPTVLRVSVDADIDGLVVTDGSVLNGADRAAGGLGHIVVPERRDAVCWCGNLGCLTAVAGAAALVRRLEVEDGTDPVARLLELERIGHTPTCTALRTAGWQLATVLRSCVTILDPAEIQVVGGLVRGSSNLRWGISELYESGQPVPRCPVRCPEEDEDDAAFRTQGRPRTSGRGSVVAAAG